VLHESMIEVGVGPLNLRNKLFQYKSNEDTKLKAQTVSHQNPIPQKKRWGTILHKDGPIPPKDIDNQT